MKGILLVLAATLAGAPPVLDFGSLARPSTAPSEATAPAPVSAPISPGTTASYERATTRISDILSGHPSAVSDRARLAPVVPRATDVPAPRTSTLPRASIAVRAVAARPAPTRAEPAPVRSWSPPRPSPADLPGEREALARVESDLFGEATARASSPPARTVADPLGTSRPTAASSVAAPPLAPTAPPAALASAPPANPPTAIASASPAPTAVASTLPAEEIASRREALGTSRRILPEGAAPDAEPPASRGAWRAPRPGERPATGWIGLGLVALGGAGFVVWSRLRARTARRETEALPPRTDLQELVRTARRVPPPGTLFDRTVTGSRRLSPIGFHSEVERRIASRSLRDEGDFEEEREEIEAARTLLERGVSPRVVRETTGARASEVKLLASLEKHRGHSDFLGE